MSDESSLVFKIAGWYVLGMTSLFVAGTCSILNAALLVSVFQGRSMSHKKAKVLKALGVLWIFCVGCLCILRLIQMRLGDNVETIDAQMSIFGWAALSILSLSITITLLVPSKLWSDK